MMDSYYIYASSKDSTSLYVGNTAEDFICQFPEEIYTGGNWEIAIKQLVVSIPNAGEVHEFYICSDNIQPSIVNGKFLSVLNKTITYGGRELVINFASEQYVKVSRPKLPSLRIYMYDVNARPFSLEAESETRCTLHLRKR